LICYFKKTFLKDLAEVPAAYRKKIENMVFEHIPSLQHITNKIDFKKIQSYESYYRIRIGPYRIGCEILAGNKIIFYRVKNRKDIYKVFP
jgi:mRNA interferase RelE/StbE